MEKRINSEQLKQIPLFEKFESEALFFLETQLWPIKYVADDVLLSPKDGIVSQIFFIKSGQIRIQTPQTSFSSQNQQNSIQDTVLSIGDCFPIGAVSAGRNTVNTYIAISDVEVYALTGSDFNRLLEISPTFNRFCTQYLSSLVADAREIMQAHFAKQATEQSSLSRELKTLITRAPITISNKQNIEQAVIKMVAEKVGSVIVINDENKPQGVITQTDIVRRVVLPKISLSENICKVMTIDPVTFSENAIIYDAMHAMAERGIQHMILINSDGEVSGVVSESDLFTMQRINLGEINREIAKADSAQAVKKALEKVKPAVYNMLAHGVNSEKLTIFISSLNDCAVEKILNLNCAKYQIIPENWCWLAFGSEGRQEQTLSTDQDNGIIFDDLPAEELESYREKILIFADNVNSDLDICGFPLCKGKIMANNPNWCLSITEWKNQFSMWIRKPEPESLLNATIFFDFRGLFGKKTLADDLFVHLQNEVRDDQIFQKMMAVNALIVSPPLGIIRDFVTEKDNFGRDCINLKKHGTRLFVDVARVIALANGIKNPSTSARLREVTILVKDKVAETNACIEAFNYLQLLRFRHQHTSEDLGQEKNNLIPIESLNTLDKRILKEVFRQAKKLQLKIKLKYQI